MHNLATKIFRGAARGRVIRTQTALAMLAALTFWAGNCPGADVMEFGLPVASSAPERIVFGPDGNYWWVASNVNIIGKITPEGLHYQWVVPTWNSRPFGITVGADGNLWFTECFSGDVYNPGGNKICRAIISTSTNPLVAPTMQEFNIEPAGAHPGASGITSGPDGNLWVLEPSIGGVAVMSTKGTLVKEFHAPQPRTSTLNNIITGPDGNLWFTDSNNGMIEAMNTNGAVAAFFLRSNSTPMDIMVGHDNAIWFTEYGTNKIGRVTTDVFSPGNFALLTTTSTKFVNTNYNHSSLIEFEMPTNHLPNTYPFGLASATNGDIYFTEWTDAKVGRFTPVVTPAGVTITNMIEYTCPTTNSNPRFIAAGTDGKIWFDEYIGNIIGQITPTLPSIYIQKLNDTQIQLTWNTNRGFALQFETLGTGTNGWITSQAKATFTNGMYSLVGPIVTNRIYRLHGLY